MSALPHPSLLAGPSGFVLMPYEHTCRHWVEVTGHSPPGTGDERGSLSSAGVRESPKRMMALSTIVGLLGTHPAQWMGRSGWKPGEKLSSSLQMRIVSPTLPGLQGPPLEPLRSQNLHLCKWARFPRAPLPRPSLGSVGFDTSL